jgi:uncharacterized protein involved in exopolysaccharide biosynthesis
MNDLPLLPREDSRPVLTPLIPLDYANPGLSFSQMISILKARRWMGIFIVLGVLGITALAMALWPRTYNATVTLMVNYEINDPNNGKELPVGQVASYIATQVELMQTQEVLLAVVDRLQLTSRPEYSRGFRKGVGTLREWAADQVAKKLAVYQSQRGSQLIYITYSARSADEAAQVANAVAAIYKEQDDRRSTGPPSERARRYALQLEELKGKVNETQQALTAFNQRNALIETSQKVELDVLANLEGRLLEAQNMRRAAQARATTDAAVSDQVLSSNQTQALKTQLAAQELRQAQLERMYMSQHPDVLDVQLQLALTRRALAASLKSYSDNARAGLNSAQQLETSLQRAVDAQRAKVRAKGPLQDESAKYVLALESAQAVYKRALEGYDQIIFAAAGPYANVRLVSQAKPPLEASKPKVMAGLVLGALTAALLGLGVPLGFEMFNRRVRCRDDIEHHHGIPVLAEFGRLPRRLVA